MATVHKEFYDDAMMNAERNRYTNIWDDTKVNFPKRWARLIGKDRVNATLTKVNKDFKRKYKCKSDPYPMVEGATLYGRTVTSKSNSYRYVTKHGIGPGTLPKDVTVLDVEYPENSYDTILYLDRPLSVVELDFYDIYPETYDDPYKDKYYYNESYNVSYDEAYEQFDKFCNIYFPDENFGGGGTERESDTTLHMWSQVSDELIILEKDGSITFDYAWYDDEADDVVPGKLYYDSLESFLKETDTTIPYVSNNGFSDVFGYNIWENR